VNIRLQEIRRNTVYRGIDYLALEKMKSGL